MKIVAVIQARIGSTRLPGKVLLPLRGRPVLERMLARVAYSQQLDDVVIATTRLAADDSIRALCSALGVRCISGDPTDLLDRHLHAARATAADVIVKIPSDCPLIDPTVIDQTVGHFRDHFPRYDFVSNLHPGSWPDGNDVEVIARDVLEEAAREAQRPLEREHTTPFIWDQPGRFTLGNVAWSTGLDLSATHRLTLDYPEDYGLISAVFDALHHAETAPFSVGAIVDYLNAHPEVRALNAARLGYSWTAGHADELRTLRRTMSDAEDAAPVAGP